MKYLSLILAFVSYLAEATAPSSNSKLNDYLVSKVTTASHAFEQACAAQPATPSEASDEIEFKQFFLGFTASATFGIKDVVDIQVSPEITFIWEKVNDGYSVR